MLSPEFLLLLSTALLAVAVLWPVVVKAGRRRDLATSGKRRAQLAPVHYAGPAVLITASVALQLSTNFL